MSGVFPVMQACPSPNPRLTICLAACLAALTAAGVTVAVQLWELFAWFRGLPPYGDATLGVLEAIRLLLVMLLLTGSWWVWRTFWAPAEVVVHRVCLAASLTIVMVAGVMAKQCLMQWTTWPNLVARPVSAALVVLFLSFTGRLCRLLAGRPL